MSQRGTAKLMFSEQSRSLDYSEKQTKQTQIIEENDEMPIV